MEIYVLSPVSFVISSSFSFRLVVNLMPSSCYKTEKFFLFTFPITDGIPEERPCAEKRTKMFESNLTSVQSYGWGRRRLTLAYIHRVFFYGLGYNKKGYSFSFNFDFFFFRILFNLVFFSYSPSSSPDDLHLLWENQKYTLLLIKLFAKDSANKSKR
jgi:hypothetical protein